MSDHRIGRTRRLFSGLRLTRRSDIRIEPAGASFRLVLITALLAVGLAAVGATLAWRAFDAHRAREVEEAQTSARAAAADADRFLRDRILLLQALARGPAVRGGDVNALRDFFVEQRAAEPGIAQILLADLQGAVPVHALPDPQEVVNIADRDYFRAVVTTGAPFVSAAVVGRFSNSPVVVIAVPVRDRAGALTGILAAGITLEQLEETLTHFSASDDRVLQVVDRAGQLVVGGRPGADITDVSAAPLLRRARGDQEGVIAGTSGVRGDPNRLVAFSDVASGDWLVFVERSASAAFAPARRDLAITLGSLAVLLLAGVSGVAMAGHELNRAVLAQRRALNDVTAENAERRRAEEALRLSEQRFRSLVQNVSDIVVVLDPTGKLQYVSPSVERILGYPPGEWLGRNAFELIHPDDIDRVRQALGRVAQEPGIYRPIEFRLRAARGSWRYLEAVANNLLDEPSVGGIVETVRDITERKRIEEAVQFLDQASTVLASSIDYETTLGRVAHLAVPTLADWCAVDMIVEDGAIRRLAVAAVDPAKGRMLREMLARYPLDPNRTTGVPHVLRTREPELVTQVTDEHLAAMAVDTEHLAMLRRLGMRSILRVPLVAGGRAIGVISLMMAESGRRYTAASMRLAQALARRSAIAIDNAHLYHKSQAALTARDEFFSSISHDLRTPLTSIKTYSQLLQRRLLRSGRLDDVETALEALGTIDDSTSRMTALISQLLDLSRLQTGRPLDLELRPADLKSLVRQESSWLQKTAAGHEIIVTADVPELVGMWDAGRLERVLTNLLTNAAKYSPGGSPITITLTREDTDAGSWAVLSVRDQGIGIPAEDLPRVFERFHRGANVGAITGTGIGLAGARQIVEQHGGTITVESTEGEGTTVTVRLPLAGTAAHVVGRTEG